VGMPRRLILMRHAKSSWKQEAATDHERCLNRRGRRDAPRIARELRRLGWWPDLVLSSDSQRTRETWELMSAETDPPTAARFSNQLYLAGLDEIEEVVRQVPNRVSTLLVLGHNPGWEEAASVLSGVECEMTTGNCALLESEYLQWHGSCSVQAGWRLVDMLRPRALESGY